MKRKLLVILSIAYIFCLAIALSACANNEIEHIHDVILHDGKEATCTEEGWADYVTCSQCDYSTYETIPALGHDEILHDGEAATCTEEGWADYACSRCDYTSYEVIPALGHDEILHDGEAATCTEDGWADYVTCSQCDYSTYETIPALGHDEILHDGKTATCTEEGWDEYITCSRCNYTTFDKYIPALHVQYELNEYEYTVAGFSNFCTDKSIVFPSEYMGIPVTAIGNFAFNGQNGIDKPIAITSVTIPESVITIGESAFSNCTSLTSITIPDSVTTIGDGAFLNCIGLKSIRIPNTVTSVGQSAFQNCILLIDIAFGDSMTEISNSMFDGCGSLRSITIPDNIKSIGEEAFRSCTNLANIVMGKGVLNIGYRAFFGCTGLKSVEVGESVTEIGKSAFESCTSLESIVIPNSVRYMGIGILANCQKSLKTISIPYVGAFRYNDVPDFLLEESDDIISDIDIYDPTTYGHFIYDPTTYGHFGYLFGATSNHDNRAFTLNLLSNVTVIITDSAPITYGSFVEIWGVTTIIIKEGMTEIMTQGLAFCWELETLVVPKSLKTVAGSVFYATSTLQTVYYGGTEAEWNEIAISPEYGNNLSFTNATRYYAGQWHYDENGIPTAN